ncbi:MAG TPA: hypothetical protein VHK44_05100 [Xanthobacteraceae bacterium]|nr:hypothetical protein [Xanthobacteraceae bacterium]
MPHIRLTAAAAAAAVVLAFALSPANARPCNDGDAGCVTNAQPEPMKLDQFMKTWKPVAKSKRAKQTKSVKQPPVKEIASKPAVAETAPPPPGPMQPLAAQPEQPMETNALVVTSSSDVNETDGFARQVQVVAFNEVNEVDLAAPAPPAPDETVGQSVSAEQPAADTSWMGKLLLAVAGTIALAGATRLLVT